MQFAVPFTVLYFPVAHKEHAPPFGPVAPTSHTHAAITTLPAPETAFDVQFRHVPAPLAPTVPEYVFAPQSRQVSFPVTPLYLPAAHRVHKLPFPLAPALHRHSTLGSSASAFAAHARQTVEPTPGMYVPAAQDVQLLFPVTFLYLPGTHSEHGPPFGPVAPALHTHAVTTELDTDEFELSAHATQTSDAFAPTIPEYVPAPQLVQAAVPFATLYFPVTHNEHVPPFGPVAPTLHTQAAITTLPVPETAFAVQFRHIPDPFAPTVPEYVFETQSIQLPFPVTPLYFPAPHRTHTLPFPLAPALHRHSTLGSSASAFAAHDRQAVPPTPGMYVPAAHDVQFVSAIRPLNLPASQIAQVPSAVTV